MTETRYSLAWASHIKNICDGLCKLQQNGEFVDMTLAADGHMVKVHQIMLAMASPYLKELIISAKNPHPIIILNKITHSTMIAILEYIYSGQVLVSFEHLKEVLGAAKELQIRGLKDMKVHPPGVKTGTELPAEHTTENILYDDESCYYQVTQEENSTLIEVNEDDQDDGMQYSNIMQFSTEDVYNDEQLCDDTIGQEMPSEQYMQEQDMQEQDIQEQDMQEQDIQEQQMQEQHMQEQHIQEQDMQEQDIQEQDMQEQYIQEQYIQEQDEDINNEQHIEYLQNEQNFEEDRHCSQIMQEDSLNVLEDDASQSQSNMDCNLDFFRTKCISEPNCTTLQYTVSNQGSLQMILNRYMYYLKYTNRDKSRQWRCVDYLSHVAKCPAQVITKDDIVVQRVDMHTHPFHDKRILKKLKTGSIFTAIISAEKEGQRKKRKVPDIQ